MQAETGIVALASTAGTEAFRVFQSNIEPVVLGSKVVLGDKQSLGSR